MFGGSALMLRHRRLDHPIHNFAIHSTAPLSSVMPKPSRRDRFVGCMLGHAIGDAFGAPFEGLDAYLILSRFGRAEDLTQNPVVETLHYTDDTLMSVSVAEVLLAHDGIDPDALAQSLVARYDPRRGYGQGARDLIHRISEGGDWREEAAALFDGGSFGNGACMRAHPVGLRFSDDPKRMVAEAQTQARVTHAHELGIEAAVLQTVATAYCLNHDTIIANDMLGTLRGFVRTEEFEWQLTTARALPPADTFAMFGNGLEAHRSWTTALLCFLVSPHDYPAVIGRAVALGGDTDTIAAMAGALAGAFNGVQSIPKPLMDRLEDQDGVPGRGMLLDLAEAIYRQTEPV